jgi:hypothetical protein
MHGSIGPRLDPSDPKAIDRAHGDRVRLAVRGRRHGRAGVEVPVRERRARAGRSPVSGGAEPIDLHRLWVHPVVLGRGKRLLGDGGSKTDLSLVDTTTSSSGTVVLSYQPAGEVA